MSQDLFVGVDVGGTKIAAGLVNASGEISSQTRVPMISSSSPEAGLQAVLAAIAQVIPAGPAVQGIGICAPGPLDPSTGVVLNPPNVPCWRNFPLAESVRRHYSVAVKVDNDANAAALAETRWGAARGCKYVFYATIGTGIGTGVVLDGKIYHGRTGSAAEGGHVSIDYRGPICRCGKPGCIEILASGTAIGRAARDAVATGQESSMHQLAGGDMSAITGETVAKAHAAGDLLANEILAGAVEKLAIWLSNMVDLFDPDVIVIGGGAAVIYQPWFTSMRNRIADLTLNPRVAEIPIVAARYGADAGIAGAAALCT